MFIAISKMVQNLKWWNSITHKQTHTHTHTKHDHLRSLFFLGRNVKLQNYTNAQKKEDMLSELTMRGKLRSIKQQISTGIQIPHQKLQMMNEAEIV